MQDEITALIDERSKAPKVTPADIEAAILSEHYFTARDGVIGAISSGALKVSPPNQKTSFCAIETQDGKEYVPVALLPLRLLTFCVLVLRNGFTVTGTSACASPENYDKEIGERVARQKAVEQVWPLLGYALRERLHHEKEMLDGRAVTRPVAEMQAYLGEKLIHAKPMDRGSYCDLGQWPVPGNANPSDEGYLVEDTDKQDGNVEGYLGYVSWSPKDVFERAYRRV